MLRRGPRTGEGAGFRAGISTRTVATHCTSWGSWAWEDLNCACTSRLKTPLSYASSNKLPQSRGRQFSAREFFMFLDIEQFSFFLQ